MKEVFWPIIDIEHVDAYPWVIIPPRAGPTAPSDEWDDIDAWCLERAADLWGDRDLDPGPHGVGFVGGTLARCAKALCPPESTHWLFLHLDHPTDVPLPVCAAIGPAQGPRELTLRALTEADDPNAVEPPVVKSFHSLHLGDGMSTFRYVTQEDSPHVLACVRYAWQVAEHEADVLLWTATEDVARVLQAADDVEELACSLAIFVP
ncbi:hypothetical protein ACFSUJ_19950 [Streptomyces lusitanus]|uniref:Uncharacterized protein n=1 Tax=Streptomyces lusitanus TaxID=68232 RepID=A0ABU3JW88_9ACTN|nr:hypothetical protein [Streptomyces lusitanus]